MSKRAKLPKLTLTAETPAKPSAESLPAGRRDREGKKIIAGHFPRSTWMALRRLGMDQDKTSQELLEEALTDLLAKYRLKQSA
jgi:hypothetical protein